MKKILSLLYGLLITDVFLIGQIPIIGGINLLQITTVLILIVCAIMEKHLFVDKWLGLYFIFILFYFISALYTGFESGFFRYLRSQLIVCYALYFATYTILKWNISLNYFIYPIIAIGIIDAIVTVLQAYGLPIQNIFFSYLIRISGQEDLIIPTTSMLGQSVSGFYQNPVFNGHSLLVFCIVSLLLLYSTCRIKQLVGLIASIIVLIGLFYCQQRGGFFISLAIWGFVVFKYISNTIGNRFISVVLILAMSLFVISNVWGYVEMSESRIFSDDDSGRRMLLEGSINYYAQHPLLGGYAACIHKIGRPSHNFFVSAFLAGGLFGGLTLVIMVLRLVVIALNKIRNDNIITIFALLFLGLVADSMVHNTGFVEGDPSTFLALALLLYITKFRKEEV